MSCNSYVLAMTSICDREEGFKKLSNALIKIDETLKSNTNTKKQIKLSIPQKIHSVTNTKKLTGTVTKLENGKYEYKITDDTWVSVTFAKKAIIEIPKTGVATYISLLLLVVPTLGLIYLNIKEKSLFKKI